MGFVRTSIVFSIFLLKEGEVLGKKTKKTFAQEFLRTHTMSQNKTKENILLINAFETRYICFTHHIL
jgi:hypothetical protein